MNEEQLIDLIDLEYGMSGLTPATGEMLSEAAAVCLEDQGHRPGVTLTVHNHELTRYLLNWKNVTGQMLDTYNDMQNATEWAAVAVSILLLLKMEGLEVVRQSAKGSGFDYWIGPRQTSNELPFTGLVRLEVSGILNGTLGELNR